jgi:sugar diacid utilization regulator
VGAGEENECLDTETTPAGDEGLVVQLMEHASSQVLHLARSAEQYQKFCQQVRETNRESTGRKAGPVEDELATLVDTAWDLVGLPDIGSVFTTACRWARQVIAGVDVACLLETNPTASEARVRAVDGATTDLLHLRIRAGQGLAGQVLRTGNPLSAQNYMTDDAFQHTPELDAAVTAEGIGPVLTVPLRREGHIVAVLTVARRRARPFSAADVVRLMALGERVVAATVGARLLEDIRGAVTAMDVAQEAVAERAEEWRRAADSHRRMTQALATEGGVRGLATAVAESLQADLTVYDTERRVLVVTGEGCAEDERLVERVEPTGDTWRSAVHVEGAWVTPLVAEREVMGTLVARPRSHFSQVDVEVLRRSAAMLATLLLTQRTAAEAENRVRKDLLDELLAARPEDAEHLCLRAQHLGRDLTASHVLVAVHATESRTAQWRSWAASYTSRSRGLTTQRNGLLILLLPGDNPQAAADRVVKELSRAIGQPVTAGAAGPVTDPSALGDSCREAMSCAEVLLALGRTGDATTVEQLGFVGFLVKQETEIEPFIDAAIGPVLSYDERRGTALRATLQAYLDNGQNLSRTAKSLHIHVNTATQRLNRITDILGSGWQDPQRALDIHVALRIHQVRRRSSSDNREARNETPVRRRA